MYYCVCTNPIFIVLSLCKAYSQNSSEINHSDPIFKEIELSNFRILDYKKSVNLCILINILFHHQSFIHNFLLKTTSMTFSLDLKNDFHLQLCRTILRNFRYLLSTRKLVAKEKRFKLMYTSLFLQWKHEINKTKALEYPLDLSNCMAPTWK